MRLLRILGFKRLRTPGKLLPLEAREGLRPRGPAYYEIWGGLESANRALWAALWFALTVALLALVLVRVQASRPPVVIRVSDSGRTEGMGNAGRQPPVSEVEARQGSNETGASVANEGSFRRGCKRSVQSGGSGSVFWL